MPNDKKREPRGKEGKSTAASSRLILARVEPIDPPDEEGTEKPDRLMRALFGGPGAMVAREKPEP
jgi:hypothetical protein